MDDQQTAKAQTIKDQTVKDQTVKDQTVKDQILHLLKMQGAQTAGGLAERLGVSPMAVRQHLQALKAGNWVVYQEERRPLGRPVKLWQLAPRSRDRFPDSHADLMVDLLRSIETVFGAKGIDQLMLDRKQRQIQTYLTKVTDIPSWQQKVQKLAHLRTQEGYMAEVIEQSGGALLLVENHCPICAAAQNCQKLCTTELDVFRSVLGTSVTVERIEHILQGDRRCAYRVTGSRL
jgi:predicted ArsR family transcriptional regulator